MTISRGPLCANVPQARRPSACIGNSQRDQRHFETNKMGREFLLERPLHTSDHGLLIEYGPICHIVKLPISMIRLFSLVNNSHITLYPSIRNSKSLRKYWGKYGQISFYIISCITRDCIIVENIFLVQWEISILTSTLPNILKIASILIEIWQDIASLKNIGLLD